jgi:predicted adenylyl cyclase CyaB
MPRNLEIKASIKSVQDVERIAKRIGAVYQGELHQRDTYFVVAHGRLKLREINDTQAELIYYKREEKTAQRWSDYLVVSISNPSILRESLSQALGVRVVVVKQRRLYLFQNARIHIDTVRGLGKFLEFEVVVKKGESQARSLLKKLLQNFSLKASNLLLASYSDLFLHKIKKNQENT